MMGPGSLLGAPPPQDRREDHEGPPEEAPRSLFRPLAALYLIDRSLTFLARNSTIANAYLSSMGKMFGAAIDLLLVPFIPLFNLLMSLMGRLLAWLVTSGILERIWSVMDRAATYLERILSWVGRLVSAFAHGDLLTVARLIVSGTWAALKTLVKDPLGALTVAVLGLAAGGLAWRAVGGPLTGLALGGAAATRMVSPTALVVGGRVLGGVGLGILAQQATSAGLGAVGVRGAARDVASFAAGGAAIGAVVGTPLFGVGAVPGALIGGAIGGGLGLLRSMLRGGGAREAAPARAQAGSQGNMARAASVTNSYNTVYLTQHNYFSGGESRAPDAGAAAARELARRLGFALSRADGASSIGRW
jgi:hypothetical protein